MEKYKVNNHEIEAYAGVEDLPIGRYKKFNLQMLRDSGIGTNMEAIIRNLTKMDDYMQANKWKEASIMRANIQSQLFSTLNELDYKQLAFVCLIHSIDGDVVEDVSDTGLIAVVKKLETIGLTQRFVMEMVEKKKTR